MLKDKELIEATLVFCAEMAIAQKQFRNRSLCARLLEGEGDKGGEVDKDL